MISASPLCPLEFPFVQNSSKTIVDDDKLKNMYSRISISLQKNRYDFDKTTQSPQIFTLHIGFLEMKKLFKKVYPNSIKRFFHCRPIVSTAVRITVLFAVGLNFDRIQFGSAVFVFQLLVILRDGL